MSALTVVVTSPIVKLLSVARWILNPCSLFELSVQVNVTLAALGFAITPTANTLDGAAGAFGPDAIFEYAELVRTLGNPMDGAGYIMVSPTILNACTR